MKTSDKVIPSETHVVIDCVALLRQVFWSARCEVYISPCTDVLVDENVNVFH